MRKSISLMLLLLIMILLVTSCGYSDKPELEIKVNTATPEPTATVEPVKEMTTITVYYTDVEFSKLIDQKVEVESGSSQLELVEHALAALQQNGTDDAISLWKLMEFLSVKLEGGAVTIDLHMPDEARLGAPGEAYVIETLQNTLFQFDFVKSYDLLVDGAVSDSLMGHVELEHPFNRTE